MPKKPYNPDTDLIPAYKEKVAKAMKQDERWLYLRDNQEHQIDVYVLIQRYNVEI